MICFRLGQVHAFVGVLQTMHEVSHADAVELSAILDELDVFLKWMAVFDTLVQSLFAILRGETAQLVVLAGEKSRFSDWPRGIEAHPHRRLQEVYAVMLSRLIVECRHGIVVRRSVKELNEIQY